MRAAAAFAAVMSLILEGQAFAQVMEIDETGAVTRYDGPMVTTSGGTTLLSRPRAPPPQGVARVHPRPSPTPEVAAAIQTSALRRNLPPALVEAVAWRESGFDPQAVSNKGAMGVMGLMPGSARMVRVNPADAVANVDGGAEILARMLKRYGGDLPLALAAYNAGPGAVQRYGGPPPYAETTAYIRAVTRRYLRAQDHIKRPAP